MEEKWWYKKHKDNIEVLDIKRTEYIRNILNYFGQEENKNLRFKTLIDWENLSPSFTYSFNYIGGQEKITEYLKQSSLVTFSTVIIDIGYEDPIIKMNTMYFVENWLDFFKASAYLGFIVSSEPLGLVMEFTEDNFLVHSNFIIEKESL